MKLIDQIIEGEYTTNIYDNGTREKFLTEFPPKIVQPQILSDDQEMVHQTLINTEVLLALKELEGTMIFDLHQTGGGSEPPKQ